MSRTDRTTWPEVMDRMDLAVVWGVTQSTVDRMRRRGDIPPPLPGLVPRWSKADITAWLDRPGTRKGYRRAA